MPRPMPTPAEQSEMNRRTNEIGLFNFAESYLLCGKTLTSQKIEGLKFGDPIEFMFQHSIELFLKSYLRAKGVGIYNITNKYGHNLTKLYNKSKALGLQLNQKDTVRIKHLQKQKRAVEARYISTGTKQPLPLEALLGTAERIRDQVQQELIQAGKPVRPGPFYPGMTFDTSHRTFPGTSEDT